MNPTEAAAAVRQAVEARGAEAAVPMLERVVAWSDRPVEALRASLTDVYAGGHLAAVVDPLAERAEQGEALWLYALGFAYSLVGPGGYPQALKLFEQALGVEPSMKWGHYSQGFIWHEMGQHKDARCAYERALDLDPHFVMALYNLGVVHQSSGNRAAAQACFERAVSAEPTYSPAWVGLGTCRELADDVEGALRYFEHALNVQPTATVLFHAALGWEKQGDVGRAVSYLVRASQLEPESARICANLGAVMARAGHSDDAVTWYRKALDLEPHSPRVQFNLGRLLMGMGREADSAA
ncbi:MAG TPA: tetratricopeptide repeat protein [Candidatus Xenobia bacterium]